MIYLMYGKCPKLSYTKVSNKIAQANSADPGQTEESDQSTLFAIPLSI